MPELPEYESYGDAFPPYGELQAIAEGCWLPGPNRLLAMFIGTEVYLDLATVDPQRADHWFRQAGKTRRHIEQFDPRRGLRRRLLKNQLELVATSYIRQAEMPHWQQAVHSEPLENQHEPLLGAAERILPLLNPDIQPPQNDKVYAKLLEFMPVLLGARALHRLTPEGWFGRMALSREQGRRNLAAATENSNWDSCAVLGNNPREFLSPKLKLSVKNKFKSRGSGTRHNARKNRKSYINAGVLPISASNYGFNNPRQMIASCLQEFGPLPPIVSDVESMLSSEQLDAMTESLKEDFVGFQNRDLA